ncbi:MAG TPA: cation:proton antiporter [Patescibacteria group bacterium]|nr:cation:proton antiporter [Patescibacteria group bacterium]
MAPDHIDTLTSIALVTTAALLCGLALIRLRQPAIVGYILAGVALGPTGLKLVESTEMVQVLAELGVIMLLFLIGMELSLRSFKTVYKTALSAAVLQIAAALAVFWGIGHFLDWTLERIVVIAFATALSSTAVAIKILEETDELRTPVGRTTVSVLVAQDLAVIPMLLIIGAFGSNHANAANGAALGAQATTLMILLKLAIAIGLLVAVSLFLSKRDRVNLPMSDWIVSRHEVIPLAAMAFCFTWATLSGLIGLSTAYGAFLAGLIIGNSNMRATLHKAAEPIQAILLMVFFLSIGLLIDLGYIFDNWKIVLLVLAAVTFLKTTVNVAILHWLGEPWYRAFQAGVVMGQIGEFSFILVAGGLTAKVISPDGYRLMISVIALSLLISPMWLAIARRLHAIAIRKLGVNLLTPAQD